MLTASAYTQNSPQHTEHACLDIVTLKIIIGFVLKWTLNYKTVLISGNLSVATLRVRYKANQAAIRITASVFGRLDFGLIKADVDNGKGHRTFV